MELVLYNKRSLQEFVDSSLFHQLDKIPISRHRAISQINNPRAKDTDILLAVKYNKNKLVAYLGALPDWVFDKNTKIEMAWLTAYWVADTYRGQGIAEELFEIMVKFYDYKIMITNLAPFLESIYQKKGIFVPAFSFMGHRFYLRSNLAEILPPKKKYFQNSKGFLNMLDYAVNILLDRRLNLLFKITIDKTCYREISTLGTVHEDFIHNYQGNNLMRRRVAELNWIHDYPWILENGEQDNRYHFSSIAKQFKLTLIQITDKESLNIIGFALISIRDKNMMVQYVFTDDKGMVLLANYVVNQMLELKLNMLTVFDIRLIQAIKLLNQYPFYHNKIIRRPIMIGKCFSELSFEFQAGDGDVAFY